MLALMGFLCGAVERILMRPLQLQLFMDGGEARNPRSGGGHGGDRGSGGAAAVNGSSSDYWGYALAAEYPIG